MMEQFTTSDLAVAARRISSHVAGIADDLNTADGKLGDGDLGITMAHGWQEVANAAVELPEDVGMAFLEYAKCFQRASSSSFGTLVATAFMSAAKACKGQTAVPYSSVAGLLRGAGAAMMARGKGELGAKSVLDAVEAMAVAAEGKKDGAAVLAAVEEAVQDSLARFRGRPNKLGRARMFGEKSIGLDDPGMLAAREIVRGLTPEEP